jgi:MFS family permease
MVRSMPAEGILADRMDPRRLILSSQLLDGVLMVGLALNAASAHPSLWHPMLIAARGTALGTGPSSCLIPASRSACLTLSHRGLGLVGVPGHLDSATASNRRPRTR